MRPFVFATALALAGISPEFSKFPPEGKLIGKAAPMSMNRREARTFRTVLRREAAEGPNFNGHYRIAYWGGGTGVVSFPGNDKRRILPWECAV